MQGVQGGNKNQNGDFSQFQENLFKNFTIQNGVKEKPINIDQKIFQQDFQKTTKIINFNKGQQNQSFLTSLLFKHAKIDNISVEIKPFNQQFAEIMSIIEQRTIGQADQVRQRTRNKKNIICQRQVQEIYQMKDYEKVFIDKKENLDQQTFCQFNKLINALDLKINEISKTKKESDTFDNAEKKFENELLNKDLKSYDSIHKLMLKIKKNLGSLNPSLPQNKNMGEIEAFHSDQQLGVDAAFTQHNPPMNQMKGEMEIEEYNDKNLMRNNYGMNNQLQQDQIIPEEEQNIVEKNYTLRQIDDFYDQVNNRDVENVYEIYEELQKSLEDLEKYLEANVQNKLSTKKNQIAKLFDEIKKRIHSQILQLPLNYFAQKQKDVFDYYQIPAYTETNINIQQYEQNNKETHKNIIAYQIKFSLEDLRRLTKDQLINDNLLDCYAMYLRDAHRNMKQRDLSQDKSEIIIFSHLFFETQYESMRIKKDEAKAFMDQIYPTINLFNPLFVNRFGFIVNVDLHGIKHWIFLGVYNSTREIVYYDSASGNNSYYKNLTSALVTYFQQISTIIYSSRKLDKCPRQQNGTDCGMFVLKYMQNFAYDTAQEFDQDHITQLRQKLYTFFPLLSYQQYHKKIDYETLQYFEGRVVTKYDRLKQDITNSILSC